MQVKKIAKTALFFERAVDAVMPLDRRDNIFCRSNRMSQYGKGRNLEQHMQAIEDAPDFMNIAIQMCSISNTRTWPIIKYYRWNFGSLHLEGAREVGTIEFRQPPGSKSATSTRHWINFAVAFVQMACVHGDNLDMARSHEVDSKLHMDYFKSMMFGGAEYAQMEKGDRDFLLNYLSQGPGRSLPEHRYNLIHWNTPEKMAILVNKSKKQDKTLKKFLALYGYK
ncbi:hypothetical protein M011DRAFT_470048 [Sporormia fimetaria CBS 119925]|uniref:Uncharacterized protein n=1 Tax=Sporormia fimetaria CBS 119925 TaxID=1340428 RepID=A0A6A6V775_9PLEO|nr:hypothetical protein M011DRAFT_470048 [Sporormia fimetaria CBS 119925]